MTNIYIDHDSALSGAIRSAIRSSDVYLTLREGDGTVLYSASVDKWSTDSRTTTVGLRPVAEHIDRVVEVHAEVKRAELTKQAQEMGLL